MDITTKLSGLQEISKAQLSKILNVVSNPKYLIIEPSLIRPLERVCGVTWLKGNGIEKIFKLEPVNPYAGSNVVFYMIYFDTIVFKQVVDQIRSQIENIEQPVKNKFHIIVVPCYNCAFENELEALGVYGTIRIHHFQWMPLHLDTSLLSLEIPNLYSSLFVYKNLTYLPVLSKCLWQLNFVIGKPRFILCLGEYSKAVLAQFDQCCEDRGETDRLESDFGALIIMDRNIDYTSALLTPGTYAALLAEIYNVSAGICEKKEEKLEKFDTKCNPLPEKQSINFSLDSNVDSIYYDIKNRYFTEVLSVLSNLTKELKTEKMSSREMALDEIKQYVQTQLHATKSKKKFITNHLQAAESIINILGHRYENQKMVEHNIVRNNDRALNLNYLEEVLNTENDKYITLRLFCLLILYQPMSESEIRTFWLKFLHQFGFSYGFAFHNLLNIGFIPESVETSNSLNIQGKLKIPIFSSSNSQINSKNLKQIPPDPTAVNLKFPTCTSYVFGGNYIPLITQIAGMILNSIPLDEIRTKLEVFGHLSLRNERGYPLQNRMVLIYMIGGVTYAEIAACNLLETLTGTQIVILSDRVVTGNYLMQGILDYPK
ncbi:vacuolar protein sorting-associated protein 33B [Diabrotica virgifera virgifera]|uniref:Vacuolar protein sorting-associated protein 33B n=1 Tax=Diabrotica virgifera virgifera TaxID=50390 RepID=A0A6P7FSA2_DIAVI|nr:vacuolar protein sorting-associated protein 33B [Diabrotica virgifera virgifera]